MDTIQFPTELREFLRSLDKNHVEYLLIGGYAVGYHGFPRATGDMDVWIAMHEQNAQQMIAALDAFGFGDSGATADIFLLPDQLVRFGNPPLRVEIMTSISGLEFAAAYANRVIAEIDGVTVSLISADDLKTNKRASGRPKDLGDLDNLP